MAGNIRVPAEPEGLNLRIDALDANTVIMTVQNQEVVVEQWPVGVVMIFEPSAQRADGSETAMAPLELLRTHVGFLVRRDGEWVLPNG